MVLPDRVEKFESLMTNLGNSGCGFAAADNILYTITYYYKLLQKNEYLS